jgi:hypothetical protein
MATRSDGLTLEMNRTLSAVPPLVFECFDGWTDSFDRFEALLATR